MDFVQWLPALVATGMIGMIGAAFINSRAAFRTASSSNEIAVQSAALTARVSLHTTYATPRIKAVTDFLDAVQNGRGAPTLENLSKALTAYLTLRILAFEETNEAKDVTARAKALTENLRAMVENHHHVPAAPAETMLNELDSDTRNAEAEDQEQREAGTDMSTDRARAALRRTADLRAALDLLRELQRSGGVTEEGEADLHGLGACVGMPSLHLAVESPVVRTNRAQGRAMYREGNKRLSEDRQDFAEAVARWLNAGPQ
ncbi:hypothetical protein OG444_40145 (plasmid) [Streptomyces sp. NBC_01232]|uniref:hypothetical protein n=1 Tax=Streptomyces sp. NBC_01232 TaxID=2903786 RepID=UPI002E1101CE|nr:hypothetical protein OG444_40145 [Streptomyces sp. NBC_01232]